MTMMNAKDELIKDLWNELVFATKARVTKCWSCGRVIVAMSNRGYKRTTCDDTCRNWKRRHPNQAHQYKRKTESVKPDNFMWDLYERIVAMGIKL